MSNELDKFFFFLGQSTSGVTFQHYQDYQNYQSLLTGARPLYPGQFHQTMPTNPGFSHYGAYGQEMQAHCQPGTSQHVASYDTAFAQDAASGSQYTNLNSVQPLNNVVQQMGKLEPFSELLAGRYSYYGEVEQDATTANYHPTKDEPDKGASSEEPSENTEECDENFGEIIKKSMVETVSA